VLTYFSFQLIIRSHEGPDAREKRDGFEGMSEGYTIDHIVDSGKLVTIFSAPDYPQFQVILLDRHDLHSIVKTGCVLQSLTGIDRFF